MITQRTPEWYAARCGKPTASQAWRIMGVKKNGEALAERQGYMVELVAERLTGSVTSRYTTADMQRGVDLEDAAIRAYEAETGLLTEPGYWVDMGGWGCTPDAFVEDVHGHGLLSVKCPRSTTIVRQRYFEQDIPPQYYWQAMAEMAATGRKWCDLLRYDDRFIRPDDRFWLVRIERSDEHCMDVASAIGEFCRELDAIEPSACPPAQWRAVAGGDAPNASPGAPAGDSLDDIMKYLRAP